MIGLGSTDAIGDQLTQTTQSTGAGEVCLAACDPDRAITSATTKLPSS
jgi:hypothetical protein